MESRLAAVVLSLVASAGLCLATEADDIANLVRDLDRAIVAKDEKALGRLLADDFVGVIPSGLSLSKSEYIAHHCRPGIGLQALDATRHPPAQVRIVGDGAVVNRRVHARLRAADGSEREFDVQRIEVFVRVDGLWRLASGQGTEVNLALRP
jgi:ketosteroid isomerase-like protein